MKITALPTEQRNADTIGIDEVSTFEMLQMINREDQKVARCIEKHLDKVAAAVDAAAEKFAAGGRIVYCGAGTSGRMGFMDSSECPPTFGVERERVISLMAGGLVALGQAMEDAEDKTELGEKDLRDINFSKHDILVGIAASGRTPYVIGAIRYAKSIGAMTVSVTCNEDPKSPINSLVDYPIGIYAGPEAITGSTRMKAGTVQKLVLNMFSTGMMVKTGKVYSNLMVNVQTKNEKLVVRAKGIIAEITGASETDINAAFEESDNNVALSILMILTGCEKAKAQQLLEHSGGHIKRALTAHQVENGCAI
ncbi:MAG: N-acetylmuramic acid 6-phosphate etherase [Oscillospiraceae bacterium]|nr:N-acetylmuramic acid 6-phosphate etherase [Oscillospiraceae bacterium]